MAARVRGLLAITPPRRGLDADPDARRAGITVTLPAACDAAMARDGLDPQPQHPMGAPAWWLCQMLATIPPGTWTPDGRVRPADLVAAAAASPWEAALLEGWAQATIRHGDARWAEALLATALGAQGAWSVPLAGVLPPRRREALVAERLRTLRGALLPTHPARELLRSCAVPWSADLSRTLINYLLRSKADHLPTWGAGDLLDTVGCSMAPEMVPDVAFLSIHETVTTAEVRGAVRDFLALVQFRYTLVQALSEC
jgi:hypothetical protein